MPTKFNVLISEVRAAMLFSSNDDSRYVLNGVCFEAVPDKLPIMVATDGRRLAVIETESLQSDKEPIFPACVFIVSTAFLKPLCAFAKSQAAIMEVEYHPSERVVFSLLESHCVVDSEKGALIEGNFPNWRQVVPKGIKDEIPPELALNADFMSDFAKTAKILGLETPGIKMNLCREGGAVEVHVSGKPNFYGIIMPMKSDETTQWQPEFLNLVPKPEPKPEQPVPA